MTAAGPGGRRILANLHCEDEWAGGRRTLARPALSTAAAAGTLLRAFAREGDRLWLPAPVDPARMAAVPGLVVPEIETGPPAELPPVGEVLAWGATAMFRKSSGDPRAASTLGSGYGPSASVVGAPFIAPAAVRAENRTVLTDRTDGGAMNCAPTTDAEQRGEEKRRRRAAGVPPISSLGSAAKAQEPLHDLLWPLPPPSPEVAAAVNHRGFGLRVAQGLGFALPGSRMVESLADLEDLLAGPRAPRSWVVKAPLSAAGRDRHVERGGAGAAGLAEPARRAVAGLLRRFGPLLFEPWMERTDDFGCAALLLPDGELRIVSFHRQLVDRRGQFLGIELDAQLRGCAGWSQEERGRMESALSGVAAALRAAGYHGPFGIDAWRYLGPDGSPVLHPLGEINARMTFGLVARALVDRLREPLGLSGAVRLRLGREVPGGKDDKDSKDDRDGTPVVPLLHAGGEPPLAAWIEPALPA